jgi:hypothetical protein
VLLTGDQERIQDAAAVVDGDVAHGVTGPSRCRLRRRRRARRTGRSRRPAPVERRGDVAPAATCTQVTVAAGTPRTPARRRR